MDSQNMSAPRATTGHMKKATSRATASVAAIAMRARS